MQNDDDQRETFEVRVGTFRATGLWVWQISGDGVSEYIAATTPDHRSVDGWYSFGPFKSERQATRDLDRFVAKYLRSLADTGTAYVAEAIPSRSAMN